MALQRLDHVNIRTARPDVLARFYADVLGLPAGPRPAFGFGGTWHYLDGLAVVHLVAVAESEPLTRAGLEHVAFRATGLHEFVATLERHGVEYRRTLVPGGQTLQVHLLDPDGNHIEVQFGAAEAGADADQSPA